MTKEPEKSKPSEKREEFEDKGVLPPIDFKVSMPKNVKPPKEPDSPKGGAKSETDKE